MLGNGFARAEGPGNGCHAALGNGEQAVDHALAGDQRHIGAQLLLIGAAAAHGPVLQHGDLFFAAVRQNHYGHGFGDGKIALGNAFQHTACPLRNHDLMHDHGGLLHGAQHIAGNQSIAGLGHGHKMPLGRTVQTGNLYAAGQKVAARGFHDLEQRALNAVVNALDQAGAQLNAHGHTGGFHRCARAKAAGFFVYLDRGLIAVDLDDLTDQVFVRNTHHIKHIGIAHTVGDHQRAGYFSDGTFAHFYHLILIRRCAARKFTVWAHGVICPVRQR